MTCSNCTAAAERTAKGLRWGGYSMNCAQCCARLVISARPHKPAQEAFFELFARRPERPQKPEVIEAIRAMDSGD